ncbi:abortive infection family protein [Mesorhizobium sp.]|uniref:abortive infection family protein n=1 Tax=Mesorhizobium sp. TaxID=1871066 RepID=UPI00257F410F|nr:abortive infection family protein [Mesorhizobium sp.]
MRITLSDQSIEALAQVISGGAAGAQNSVGVYRQGWKLKALLKNYGLHYELEGTSRVSETVRALMSAGMFPDADDIYENLLIKGVDPRDYVGHDDWHAEAMDYLNARLAFDDLRLERDGMHVRLVNLGRHAPIVSAFSAAIQALDLDTVQRDLQRALDSAERDPEDAVTAACSVVESVCRSILIESNLDLPAKQDISGLYRAVREPLGVSPTKEGLPDAIAEDVRNTLSGLITAVQSIGALRTHGGDAHGRERGFKRVYARIARLAIHSASAARLFLIETWKLKLPERALRKE